MKKLTLLEIAKAVGGELSKQEFENNTIDSITTDTRKIKKGDLFIPLKGDNFDGHNFIDKAFESGAYCSL